MEGILFRSRDSEGARMTRQISSLVLRHVSGTRLTEVVSVGQRPAVRYQLCAKPPPATLMHIRRMPTGHMRCSRILTRPFSRPSLTPVSFALKMPLSLPP